MLEFGFPRFGMGRERRLAEQIAAPVVERTSGIGFAGSVYTVTGADTGQWQYNTGSGWTNFSPAETGATYTMTADLEGAHISWLRTAGARSNVLDRVWVEADAPTGLRILHDGERGITDAAGLVSQWDSNAGLGNHATQSTDANKPGTGARTIGGRNALNFDVDMMAYAAPGQPSSNNSMVFAVLDNDLAAPLAANQRVISFRVTTQTRFALMHNTSSQTAFVHSNAFTPAVVAYQSGQHVISGYRNGTEQGVGYDGVYATNSSGANASALDSFNIGAASTMAEPFDGAMAYLAIFYRYDATDRVKMEGRLAHRYGLEANLDAGHLYKAAPPMVTYV